MTERIYPQKGWRHFGCRNCGNVRMLPADPDEAAPWCVHHDSNYSWRGPKAGSDWTRMVPIEVNAND